MEPRESTEVEITVPVNDDIRLIIETGTEATCYTNVYLQDEHIARLNSPSKPWENLSLVMASQVIIEKSDNYNSREELNRLQYDAMLEHRQELDDAFDWEE